MEITHSNDVTPDCSTPLVQYEWRAAPALGLAIAGGAALPATVTLTMEVVSRAGASEGDATDNTVSVTIRLKP